MDWFCGCTTWPLNWRPVSSVVLVTLPVSRGIVAARDCCRMASARRMDVAARATVGFFSSARATAWSNVTDSMLACGRGACAKAGVASVRPKATSTTVAPTTPGAGDPPSSVRSRCARPGAIDRIRT